MNASVCALEGCNDFTSGKSKYCSIHAREARQKWVAMIKEKSAERESRDAEFEKIFAEAKEAANAAGDACRPTPMIVQQHENMLDDNSPVVLEYPPEMGGVCGFAWVVIKPGNCPAANWAKKHLRAGHDYYGGVSINADGYNQSMERKSAWAGAFASILQAHGIKAYSNSRMD